MSYDDRHPDRRGRPSLATLLDAIGCLRDVIVVDDRRDRVAAARPPAAPRRSCVVPRPRRAGRPRRATPAGGRRAPTGSRSSTTTSCRRPAGARALEADLAAAGPDVAGDPGPDRASRCRDAGRPTGSATSPGSSARSWATADMAYRRAALAAVGGFDERFPRAYREDADLGLRVTAAGWRIVARRAPRRAPGAPGARVGLACAKQAGNADDVLMRRLHGRDWRERAGVPRGPPPAALATAARPRGGARRALRRARRAARAARRRPAAAVGGAGTAELAWARIAPGPRTRARGRDDGRGRARRCPSRATGVVAARQLGRAPARRRARGPRRCSSTATARWSPTSPTTATRRASSRCRARARRSTGCAPRACRIGGRLQPERHRPRPARRTHDVARRQRADGGAARPARAARVLPARPGRRLRCRKPAPGLVLRAAAPARRRPARLRRGRRHRRRRRGRARRRRARGARADGAHARARRSPRRPRSRASTCSTAPSSGCSVVARMTHVLASGSTTTATSCSPARRSARSPPAPTASRCCAARAAGRRPSCCPASTRCSAGARRGSTPSPTPVDSADVLDAWRRGSPRWTSTAR